MPDDVAIQSNKKLWWKREKGHEWQSDPSHLYKLTPSKRCPYCDVRAVCADNSLLTKYPELAREWDNELNFPLTPDQVLYCSEKKYWWRRGEFVWKASVKDLLRKGEGIPRSQYHNCYQHLRLSVTHPDLAAQWDSSKNAPLTPDQVTARSKKVVWWRCKHGHTWQSAINKRVRGDGCPYCTDHSNRLGSVAEERPALLEEWDYEKNLKTPQTCPARSNKKVWWKCSACGHEWQASPDSRFCGSSCPVCAKKHRRSPFPHP